MLAFVTEALDAVVPQSEAGALIAGVVGPAVTVIVLVAALLVQPDAFVAVSVRTTFVPTAAGV